MTKCHFIPGSEYWPLIGWCKLTTDLWLVDNSRCSHPGSELDHQRLWSLCWGHHRHLGHLLVQLLGQLLGSPETGGMKTNMNSNQTPLVHGKSVCEEIWKKWTWIFSNDTDIQWVKSSIPSISHDEPTIWMLQCCRLPTCCCKLNCKMSELNPIGCGPKVNVGLQSLVPTPLWSQTETDLSWTVQ